MLDHGNAHALDGMVRVQLEDRNYDDAETQVELLKALEDSLAPETSSHLLLLEARLALERHHDPSRHMQLLDASVVAHSGDWLGSLLPRLLMAANDSQRLPMAPSSSLRLQTHAVVGSQ